MNYRTLGTSDLKVSEISFGCMSLDVHLTESQSILNKAFDNGINFFDTADLYSNGANEKLLGTTLKSVRDEVVIATKVGNQWNADGTGWTWNPTKKYILSAVEDSLRRLQTDYIDLYQLHGGTIKDPIDDVIEAFEVLKKQGKIREYGISSIRPNVIREWVQKSNMVSVMMQYSLLDRRPEEDILPLLHHHELSVITRGTLAKGLLIDKPVDQYLGCAKSDVESLQQALKQSGNPLSVAIQFVLSKPMIASAVIGIRTLGQLLNIIEKGSNTIESNTLSSIANILEPKTYVSHR